MPQRGFQRNATEGRSRCVLGVAALADWLAGPGELCLAWEDLRDILEVLLRQLLGPLLQSCKVQHSAGNWDRQEVAGTARSF